MNSSEPLADIPTLIDLLAYRASATPEALAFELEGESMSFAALWEAVNGFAAGLLEDGLERGERVLLAMPNSSGFFPAFYGVQRAGGVPVPLFPNSGNERIERIAALCSAGRLVAPEPRQGLAPSLAQLAPGLRGRVLPAYPDVQAEDTGYIQFTSGSTGDPKGVVLSHANLLTNVRQMIAGMELTERDVFVSWLPVYHDMGLIILTMIPFYLAARLVLLPTSFVNLRRWLATIEEVKGTYTASPDFGYRLALRYAGRAEKYDLSSLRVAMNAAELARPETIEAFESGFNLHNTMTVGYGLAEATVGVCMTKPGAGVAVDADGFVSVSPPFPGVEVAILGEGGEPAPPGVHGEILVRSPACTSGYFEDPEATASLFWREGYLRTGDIGYMDTGGRLYVVGRKKEMLKHAGRTLAPREVEAALDSRPDLREVAAVSADLGGLVGEVVVVFAEVRRPAGMDGGKLHGLAVDITARVHESLGVRPGRVYLVQPRTIPQTANGKLQRSLLREQYLDGSLRASGRILYPEY